MSSAAMKPINITIKISNEHLRVINDELTRMHQLINDAKDEKTRSWALERISEMQDGLVSMREQIGSTASSVLEASDEE
jgi:Mg2+ and Co2+ transporter CorA